MRDLTNDQGPWHLAGRQWGVIASAQLTELGYSPKAIKHRIRRGRLHRVYRGVYAVGRRELSREGRWLAAVLACGDDAALSHDSAAALWEITRRSSKYVHVTVLGESRSRADIKVHYRSALNATTHKRIPVTTPEQTLVDLARTWPPSEVEQAIGEAHFRRLITLNSLRAAAADAGRSGARLRVIIDRVNFRVTQSELEREFLRLLTRAGLPLPETQKRFGKHRVDFWWPDLRLVVETDGSHFHRTAAQQANDRTRDQDHIRNGRTPLRITHAQVFKDAAETAALLAEVVARLN